MELACLFHSEISSDPLVALHGAPMTPALFAGVFDFRAACTMSFQTAARCGLNEPLLGLQIQSIRVELERERNDHKQMLDKFLTAAENAKKHQARIAGALQRCSIS